MAKIVQKEDPVLRKKAKEVPQSLFGSAELKKILEDMVEALRREEDGIAIAAPQIGVPYRIFVVSPFAYAKNAKDTPIFFINPKIIKVSKEKEDVDEGCLSVRWLYGKVKRYKKVTIEAQNEKGRHFERGGSGLLAQIFQHETDHLEGTLFIDKATDVVEVPPPEKTPPKTDKK